MILEFQSILRDVAAGLVVAGAAAALSVLVLWLMGSVRDQSRMAVAFGALGLLPAVPFLFMIRDGMTESELLGVAGISCILALPGELVMVHGMLRPRWLGAKRCRSVAVAAASAFAAGAIATFSWAVYCSIFAESSGWLLGASLVAPFYGIAGGAMAVMCPRVQRGLSL